MMMHTLHHEDYMMIVRSRQREDDEEFASDGMGRRQGGVVNGPEADPGTVGSGGVRGTRAEL